MIVKTLMTDAETKRAARNALIVERYAVLSDGNPGVKPNRICNALAREFGVSAQTIRLVVNRHDSDPS